MTAEETASLNDIADRLAMHRLALLRIENRILKKQLEIRKMGEIIASLEDQKLAEKRAVDELLGIVGGMTQPERKENGIPLNRYGRNLDMESIVRSVLPNVPAEFDSADVKIVACRRYPEERERISQQAHTYLNRLARRGVIDRNGGNTFKRK